MLTLHPHKQFQTVLTLEEQETSRQTWEAGRFNLKQLKLTEELIMPKMWIAE